MNFPDFLRIEREASGGSKYYVVHATEPRFSLELSPDSAAPDKMGRGVIKRLHVPNSWAGDYTKYSKFVQAAQEFFAASCGELPRIPEPRRRN